MRVATLSLDFGLLLLVIVALLHTQGATANREPNCESQNCVPPSHCESRATSGSCSRSGNVCCALLKREYRTHCRHHGGQCMNSCPQRLTEKAVDCKSHQICCVLV